MKPKAKKNVIPQIQYNRDYIETNIINSYQIPPSYKTEEQKVNYIISVFNAILKNYKDIHFPESVKQFTFSNYEYQTIQKNKNMYLVYLYTNPSVNHPFLAFGSKSKNTFNLLLPLGGDKGQINNKIITSCYEQNLLKSDEIIVILLLLWKTNERRKNKLLHDSKYSLFKCQNIIPCREAMEYITKKIKDPKTQKKLILEQQHKYFYQAQKYLYNYFNLLDTKKYDKAREYLKGTDPSYKGLIRLNKFFYDDLKHKNIGHLEVFIETYKLMDVLFKKI